MKLRYTFLVIAIISFGSSFGQDWNQLGSGVPIPDLTLQDKYGYSISIDGNVAVIGSPENDDINVNAGKAFVYEKTEGQWQLVKELFFDTSDPEVQFGRTVLVKGDLIFIGIPYLNGFGTTHVGGVMVYKRGSEGWEFVNELKNDFPNSFDRLGFSLSIDNGLVAVGAPGSEDVLENSGAVYLYDNVESETFPIKKIVAPETEAVQKFGISVALTATDLFVGDIRSNVNGINQGAVFVYDLTNYNVKAKLTTTNNVFNFGSTLSATLSEVAVSSWGANSNDSYGSVYIFSKPTGDWTNATEDVKVIPANGTEYGNYGSSIYLNDESLVVGSDGGIAVDFFDKPTTGWTNIEEPYTLKKNAFTYLQRFGFSFAVSGTNIIVGTYNWNLPGEYSGAAFVYEKAGAAWSSLTEKEILSGSSSSASGDKLGFSVDIDGQYAVAGAPYDDSFGESSGAAYVFKFNGNGWDRIAKLTPSDGTELDYFGWSVAISGNSIVVSALEAEPTNESGIYATGKVYVFEKPTGEWTSSHESTQITRIDNLHRGSFGYDVDIENDEIIVSHFDGGSSDEIALVYIYLRTANAWEQKAKLFPIDNSYRQFGADVVMKDNLVAISAPISENFDGSVLIFQRPTSGWVNASQNAILRPSDAALFRSFGNSIDINENTVLVGGVHNSSSAGAGYIFEKSGEWKDATEDAILLPQIKELNARYGTSVALGRDFAIVGSSQVYSESGRALIFRKIDGDWKNTNEYSLVSSFGNGDRFSYDLALTNDFLIVGAPGSSTTSGAESGSVLFYLKQPTVKEVNSSNVDGTYKIDDQIQIKVIFTQPVVVSGNPKLQISLDNNLTRDLSFAGLTADQELNFTYMVEEGDFNDDLDYKNKEALQIEVDKIKSKINMANAIKDLPIPGSLYSLSGLRNLVIDGTIVVSINEPDQNILQAYPNPFISRFQITSNEEVKIILVSTSGSHVYKSRLNANEVCEPNVPQGLYLLEIETKNGIKKRVKIIKK